MATLIAYHDVEDVQHWLASEVRAQAFATVGATVRTFIDPSGSTKVGLLIEAPDPEAVFAMLQTPEAAAAEKADRVLADTIVLLVES